MKAEIFTCPVCYEQYDQEGHLPRVINKCGHSICSICLEKIIKDGTRKCPLDNEELEQDIRIYPINYCLKQIIEAERTNKILCKEHKIEVTLICEEENKKICVNCVEDHQEKKHKFQSIDTLHKKVTSLQSQMSNLLTNVNKYRDESLKILEESKKTRVQKIKQRFDDIRKLVEEKEKGLIFETNSLIYLEKAQIQILFGENSKLVKETKKRQADLTKILEDQDFPLNKEYYSELEEYFKKWKNKMDSNESHLKIKEGFDKMNEMFDSCFKENEIFGYGFGVPLLDPLEAFIKTFSEDENEVIIQWSPEVGVSYFETSINLHSQNECLTITSDSKSKDVQINFGKLADLKEVKVILKEKLPSNDVETLKYIWQKINGTITLYLDIISYFSLADQLSRVFKGGSIGFSKIEVDLTGCALTESLILLLDTILSKASNLQTLSLVMPGVKLTFDDLSIVPLFEKMKTLKVTNLESFTLHLEKTSVSDQEINQAFFSLPNVKKYHLFLTDTKITDQSLELCTKNTLSSAPFLRDFTLYIENTKVTDQGIQYFLTNSLTMNLNKFKIALKGTQITDKSLNLLSLHLTDSLNCFEIDLRGSNISEDGLCKIFKPLENLNSFYLAVNGKNINDKVLDIFAKDALVSMKHLKNLTLIFANTTISDAGVIELLLHLPESLVNVEFDFSSSAITDKSINFLKETIPCMQKLKSLKIFIDNCNVSKSTQTKFQEALKKNLKIPNKEIQK